MKKILVTTLVLGSMVFATANSNSQEGERKGKRDISQVKTKILTRLDERIAKLEKVKSCISSASSKEELKACKPKRKNKGKGQRKGNYERD